MAFIFCYSYIEISVRLKLAFEKSPNDQKQRKSFVCIKLWNYIDDVSERYWKKVSLKLKLENEKLSLKVSILGKFTLFIILRSWRVVSRFLG